MSQVRPHLLVEFIGCFRLRHVPVTGSLPFQEFSTSSTSQSSGRRPKAATYIFSTRRRESSSENLPCFAHSRAPRVTSSLFIIKSACEGTVDTLRLPMVEIGNG